MQKQPQQTTRSNRKKPMDTLDTLFGFYRELEGLKNRFPNLPTPLKSSHEQLVHQASDAVKAEMGSTNVH